MNIEAMIQTLPIMGKGMLGIFIVTAIIVASIWILNKATSISFKKKNRDTDSQA